MDHCARLHCKIAKLAVYNAAAESLEVLDDASGIPLATRSSYALCQLENTEIVRINDRKKQINR